MKHHIAIKFIAFLLAVVSLFAMIASAAGIIFFTATDLYEKGPTTVLNEQLRDRGQWFAQEIAQEYANRVLGNCPEEVLYNDWGGLHQFKPGYYGYTLLDENGNVLESEPLEFYTLNFRYPLSGMEYMDMVAITPESERNPPEATSVQQDLSITDNLPDDLASVSSIYVGYEDGSSASFGGLTEAGILFYEEDGRVCFLAEPQAVWVSEGQNVTHIRFFGWVEGHEQLLYEISSPFGVGDFRFEDGWLYRFVSYSISPSHLPDTMAEAAADTTAVTTPAAANYLEYAYRDQKTGELMHMDYQWKPMPTYTLELFLAKGATEQEIYWDLLTEVWTYRNELFYVLGISALIFAVMAVYLCCSAGKKPGREEVRAGGFNRISLDFYAAAGGLAICGIFVFGIEVVEYLIRYSPTVLPPFLLFAGCGGCLIIVGFCFACAAQLKTPGGYWWRNLLGIRCLTLTGRGMMGAANFIIEKVSPRLDICFGKIWTLVVRTCKALGKFTAAVFSKVFHFLNVTLNDFFLWMGKKIKRFFRLLPLSWQWILGGLLLLGMSALVWANRYDGWGFVWLLLGFAMILYISYCFGLLLETTKRMNQGDLDTKVDDKLLIGCFQEFAGDLNALAGVAVVAAQKQLKSERMKTELITNVSHDIKTPLTSIINYVDLLQKPHSDEEQETYLEVLSRQSQQLKKLIEDLMEMSKASTGNMTVDIAAINAGEAIHQALGEFADKLEKARLEPVFRQPEAPIYMKADGRLAWRVMSNLLGNAVKYALPGTRLYIDLMEIDGKVIISFKNISREELNVSADELLERFVRGDVARNTEGSGLGLNIAQSLMEIQKGQLQLLVDGDLFKVTLTFPAVKE